MQPPCAHVQAVCRRTGLGRQMAELSARSQLRPGRKVAFEFRNFQSVGRILFHRQAPRPVAAIPRAFSGWQTAEKF